VHNDVARTYVVGGLVHLPDVAIARLDLEVLKIIDDDLTLIGPQVRLHPDQPPRTRYLHLTRLTGRTRSSNESCCRGGNSYLQRTVWAWFWWRLPSSQAPLREGWEN